MHFADGVEIFGDHAAVLGGGFVGGGGDGGVVDPVVDGDSHGLAAEPGVEARLGVRQVGYGAVLELLHLQDLPGGLGIGGAAHILDPDYYVLPTANYYFMAISTFLIAIVGTVITVKWTEPRLGTYTGDVEREPITQLTALEKKGMKRAGLVFLGSFALIAAGLIPENGILRGEDGSLLKTPVLRGFIALLFIMAATAGIVYGYTVGKFKKGEDVINAMVDNIKTLAPYLVMVFFAAQFVAWFDWSKLGMLLAIKGAGALQSADIGLIPLVIMFILFTAFINLFMGSASAKWAIIGPVFIPIFMLLGYSPELSQATFRVGDSITNIITPLLPYFALIITFCQKYDKKAGIGTIIANMLPYTIAFMICWVVLLIAWILIGLPLGPGVILTYP